jgi:hypothetical protein
VAPPGGFEDAVRRGRRRRRKQTGGSSALVLVLVGMLAYSVIGGDTGADRLDPTDQGRIDHVQPAPDGTASPDPVASVTPTGTAPLGGNTPVTGSGPRTGALPGATTSVPTYGPVVPSSRPTTAQVRRYAARARIRRGDPDTNTDLDCAPTPGEDWCAKATGVRAAGQTYYELRYVLCRSIAASTSGRLTFQREQEVDFAAIDQTNDDTVWTWSAGQPVVPRSSTLDIAPGYCVIWTVNWNGYDDFGYTPYFGPDTVIARPITREALPSAESAEFQVD